MENCSKYVIDPKDLPYIKLQVEIRASILSKDKYIKAIGGLVVLQGEVTDMRNYGREATVE